MSVSRGNLFWVKKILHLCVVLYRILLPIIGELHFRREGVTLIYDIQSNTIVSELTSKIQKYVGWYLVRVCSRTLTNVGERTLFELINLKSFHKNKYIEEITLKLCALLKAIESSRERAWNLCVG